MPMCGCMGRSLSAAEVIQNARQALEDMQACHAVLSVRLDTDMLQESLTVELWERHPARLRVDIRSASSPQLNGMAFTTDGQTSILYTPRTNVAALGSPDLVRLPQAVETVLQARRHWIQQINPTQAQLFAQMREGGLVVYKIDSMLDRISVRFTIDAHQWWIRQIEYREEYGDHGIIALDTMDCSQPLNDAVFNVNIPEGTTLQEVRIEDNPPLTLAEAQAKFGYKLRIPRQDTLPPDTYFQVAYQLDKNMALIYTGRSPFTLVQGPNIGKIPEQDAVQVLLTRGRGFLIEDPSHGGLILIWREGELQFSIAGSLDRDTIITIANGLE